MSRLNLTVVNQDATTVPLAFEVRRMVNAGYVGRDQNAVRAHIEELAREGIAPPPSIPMFFPVLCRNITTDQRIEVVESRTSGEAEFVLLLEEDRMYVGVGSDHTDRSLEAVSMLNSKQICPNIVSREVWDFQEIKGHWDDLLLQSWVKPASNAEPILYQKAPLAKILSATEILALVESKMTDGQCDGLVIFSGTIPVLTKEMICGTHFRCELTDPHLKRKLTCCYDIVKLDYIADS
jgi:hypothetical protein